MDIADAFVFDDGAGEGHFDWLRLVGALDCDSHLRARGATELSDDFIKRLPLLVHPVDGRNLVPRKDARLGGGSSTEDRTDREQPVLHVDLHPDSAEGVVFLLQEFVEFIGCHELAEGVQRVDHPLDCAVEERVDVHLVLINVVCADLLQDIHEELHLFQDFLRVIRDFQAVDSESEECVRQQGDDKDGV